MTYIEQLKDGRWQVKKTSIMQRDGFKCRVCGAKASDGVMLNVHHLFYKRGAAPWEYDDDDLVTLCESCHKKEHDEINSELYNIKIGDFVQYRHSDYTNSGIIYDVDFKTMTARMASIDDGGDYTRLWLDTVEIGKDGKLISGNCYDIQRVESVRIDIDPYDEEDVHTYNGFFFACVAKCLTKVEYYYEKKDSDHFETISSDIDFMEELKRLYFNLDKMLANNAELRSYFELNK